jgi:hypothetical protein
MIENFAAVSEWANRTEPSDVVYRAVVEWIAAAEFTPWQSPSVPMGPAGSVQRRTVLLPDVEVRITYNHEHSTGIVTLILID